MSRPDIHADDYALTVNTSKDMLECMRAGRLDSISVVPNMGCFEECMALFYEEIPKLPFLPLLSVHLDFVEGRSLAGREAVPDLTKPDSDLMGLGWGGLFAASYLPGKRKKIKIQLKREIKAQLARTQEAIEKAMAVAKKTGVPCKQRGLRIDSHQHAHMIPVVWEAVLEAVSEEGYRVEYIRNSREVLGVFLTDVSLYRTYRPVNFVKNRVLALYSRRADRYYRTHGMEQMYLWGLVMSGRMDQERIGRLYAKMRKKAERDGRKLEILFHPGLTLPEEVTSEIGREAAADFYLREDRHVEKAAVLGMKW